MTRLGAAGIVVVIALLPAAAAADTIDVDKTLEESHRRTRPLLTRHPFQHVRARWHDVRDHLNSRLRLELGLSYTLITQYAAELGSPDDTSVGSLDMYGIWTVLDRKRLGQGALGLLVRHRDSWGALSGNDLSERIGLPWGINDSGSSGYTRINQLWWRHGLLDGKLTLKLGRIDQTSFFGDNRAAHSGNTHFMMQSFVNDQTVRFPANGTGLNLRYQPNEHWYVTAGFGDAEGDPNDPPADDPGLFDLDDTFRAVEAGFSLDMSRLWSDLGRGNYRFMGWNSDGTKDNPRGSGVALSFDQDVGADIIPFLRYGASPDGAFRAFHALSLGIVWEKPFGRGSDRLGFGGTWAEPVDSSGRDQYATEAFYRLEFLEGFSVTADVQFIPAPALEPQRDFVSVFGLRTRLVF